MSTVKNSPLSVINQEHLPEPLTTSNSSSAKNKDVTPLNSARQDLFDGKESLKKQSQSNPTATSPAIQKHQNTPALKNSKSKPIPKSPTFSSLPAEIHLSIFTHLTAIEIVTASTGEVSRYFNETLQNEVSVWGDDAVTQARSKNITAQKAWTSQFKTLKQGEQESIILYKKSINIYSEIDVKTFCTHVKGMESSTKSARRSAKNGFTQSMYIDLERASEHAKKAGIMAPKLSSDEIKTAHLNDMERTIKNARKSAKKGFTHGMYIDLQQAAEHARKAGVPAPELSSDEIKAAHLKNMEVAMDDAREEAKAGATQSMYQLLKQANEHAKKAGVMAPEMSSDEIEAAHLKEAQRNYAGLKLNQ